VPKVKKKKPAKLHKSANRIFDYFEENKSHLLGLIAIFVFCVAVTVALLRAQTPPITTAETTPVPLPSPSPPPRTDLNIVLLGYGGGGHDGGKLTDTIMVAKIDSSSKSISLVSVPRDLWVPLPLQTGTEPTWSKINAAFAIGEDVKGYQYRDDQFKGEHGGGVLAKQLVAEVTGITPDYYLAVNFDTFTKAIDLIGPLTVTVPYTFDDYLYPIRGEEKNPCGFTETDIATLSATFKNGDLEKQFPCRYELLHFDKGKTVMDGETALKFVRSRHGTVGGSDFGRSERQQALLEAVKQKVFSLTFLPKVGPLAQQVAADVQTDFTVGDLPALLTRFKDITNYTTNTVTITDANVLAQGKSADRQFILQPKDGQGNWAGIRYFVKTELEKATASAELASPTASSSAVVN
jgi:polyisoprenyl-teichoic acid--peptidoglycan teichoic acid transferase